MQQLIIGRELITQSFSLRRKSFEPHIWHPNFWDLHLKDRTPKYLALKVNSACIHETYKAIENWEGFIFFNWCIVDLQCCANFFCIAEWFSYIYTYIYVSIYIFHILFCYGLSQYTEYNSLCYALFIHPIYASLPLLISDSQPSSHTSPPPWEP